VALSPSGPPVHPEAGRKSASRPSYLLRSGAAVRIGQIGAWGLGRARLTPSAVHATDHGESIPCTPVTAGAIAALGIPGDVVRRPLARRGRLRVKSGDCDGPGPLRLV